MKPATPGASGRTGLLRAVGIALAGVALATAAVFVWNTVRSDRLSRRISSALEMVDIGGEAQRALLAYNQQSELFEQTRGSGNEIKPLKPERELQDLLARLDRLSKQWPRRGQLVATTTAKVRAYVAAREDWENQPASEAPRDRLPDRIISPRDEAELVLAALVGENYELARALQHEVSEEGLSRSMIAWLLAAVVVAVLVCVWHLRRGELRFRDRLLPLHGARH